MLRKPYQGETVPQVKGLRLNPRQAEPSLALSPPRQTGRDNPRAGDSGRDPSLGEDTVPGEATAGRGPGGRQRGVRIPMGAHGAGPAARSGGSAAFSAPRAPGEGLGCQPGAESGSQARLRAPQTAHRLLPQLS